MAQRIFVRLIVVLGLCAGVLTDASEASPFYRVLGDVSLSSRADQVGAEVIQVEAHSIPLGAMEKRSGRWAPADAVSFSGQRDAQMWQFSGGLVTDEFDRLANAAIEVSEARYCCVSRECGNASQWASRVFRQRLLYGRDESLRYCAFEAVDGSWMTVFSAARTADRQYLHLEILTP
jgi:hypothetical protein